MNPMGLLLIGVGLFSVAGGAFDWDWFMTSRRARRFVTLLSRTGARVFYVLAGLAIAIVGSIAATQGN